MKEEFKRIIKDSILDIQEKYFVQETLSLGKRKYNERVLCYELYHQIRLRQAEFKDLTISGEAVKSKFQFSSLDNNKVPDLLIHNFGTIKNNEVVIEVKTSKRKDSVLKGLKKDFITLDLFTDNSTIRIDYKLGIYLLVNFDFFALLKSNKKIGKKVAAIIKRNKRIELWNISIPKFNKGKLINNSLKIIDNETLKEIVAEIEWKS